MKLTDEQISAWLDGSLPPEEAARIAAAVEGDKDLEDRINSMTTIDSLVRQAVPLDEAIPAELMSRLGLRQDAPDDNVVSFAAKQTGSARRAEGVGRSARPFFGGWQIAAQIALVACLGMAAAAWLVPSGREQTAEYRALSASSQSAAEQVSVIVMFDRVVSAEEAELIAGKVGAKIAGRQTAAGAWPLSVAPQGRDAVLEQLRRREDVVMAEPIDGT